MKQLIWIALCVMLFSSCRTPQDKLVYVPVETVKTKYQDRYIRDSIRVTDSVNTYHKGDTVFRDRYKYIYRDRYLKDTVSVVDSIHVPYPVDRVKEVNVLHSWQEWLIWIGAAALVIGLVGGAWKLRKIIKI